MRNYFRVILVSVLLFAGGLSAQTLKFGHISFEQLLQSMPERETAQKEIQKKGADLESKLGIMQKEFQDKLKDYTAQQKTLTEAVRADKETELQNIQNRIQTFQQTANEDMQKEEAKLFQPILEKAKKAIADVAKEQGLIYVFEVNQVLYHSEQSVDLLPLVKKKLVLK